MNLKSVFAALAFSLFISSKVSANVFVDPSTRPCDPKIADSWTYTPKPVYAPDSPKLPFRCEGNVKVFEVTAEEVFSNFDNGWEAGSVYTWGYNGSNPGPVIEALEGETIKVIFKNELPEPTTIHWHGFELPFNMDGASGHSQNPVKPGETFEYSWTINQSGTYMYHSGHGLAKQLAMGLAGYFVVHPKKKPETLVDHDVLLFLQMWTLPPHSILLNTMDMMFNYFTINGKAAPLTSPINVLTGQKVRIRFANISMMQHPIHLHGHTWRVVATGAGDNPASTHTLGNTVLVPVGQTLDVIIDHIEEPGDWNFHCHLPHHVTNNMEINPVPGEPMMMGDSGMYTLFKVRHPNMPNHNGTGGSHDGHSTNTNNDDHGGHHMVMGPKPGIYEGELNLENGNSFKVMLDIHKVQEEGEWRKLIATLKVLLGQSEYLLYHYDHVRFNWKTGELFFDEEKKGFVLESLKFMKHGDNEMLMGGAKAEFTGIHGKINLFYKPKAKRFTADVDPESYKTELAGEYKGTCKNKETVISLRTARGLNETLLLEGNPFYQYNVKGQIAKKTSGVYRVDSVIENGVFNPFSSSVSLKVERAGVLETLTCSLEVDFDDDISLNCNNQCSFKKSVEKSNPLGPESKTSFKKLAGVKINQLSDIKSLGGIFSGKLLHSSINKYQKLKLKINSRSFSNKPMELAFPHVSVTLHLDLGEGKEISYKFEERPWLDSTSKTSKNLNSMSLKGDSKVYLVITEWRNNSLDGVLFHKDYGRVGEFQAVKDGSNLNVDFENGSPEVLTSPMGRWKGNNYDLSLDAIEVDEEELEIGNPFYPLHLIGRVKNTKTGALVTISSGTYNFFTKELNLLSSDGRLIKGSIEESGLRLSIPSINERRVRFIGNENSILLNK